MDLKKERLIERWIGKNVVLDKWEKVWKISRYQPFDRYNVEERQPIEELNEVEYKVVISGSAVEGTKRVVDYLLGNDLSLLPSEILEEMGLEQIEVLQEIDDWWR
ncbi:hypothetical protein [Lactococcus formosensis]|jgi:hypothetical protein|uniref:hypothetical protein n=1 Tax=Lactococcus formosensis TaxID=1281486 RepID=UPI001BD0F576|nr:hypothetical protein [Lactococcus formosensis]